MLRSICRNSIVTAEATIKFLDDAGETPTAVTVQGLCIESRYVASINVTYISGSSFITQMVCLCLFVY